MADPEINVADAERFLRARFEAVTAVELLKGGSWSTAFGFRSAERSLVVRFGRYGEDYQKDRIAGGWARPRLPAPTVVEIGDAFEGAYAVSTRLTGEPIDRLPPERLARAIDSLLDTLAVVHEVVLPGRGYGMWAAPAGDAPHRTWRDFMTAVAHRDDDRLRGWRERLAAVPMAQTVFDRANRVLESGGPGAYGRHVVHSDLLYGNVLVSSDNRVSGVFDWGNSLAGDPVYDLAWLMFWAPWHPGIDAAHVRDVAEERYGSADLGERLVHCQLHIAAETMQYQAFAGLRADLEATAGHATRLLDTL